VARLLLNGALESSIPKNKIKIILDERIALLTAIENSKPGDIIVIFFENYQALIDIIKKFVDID
jgi:cyanophycin synthetase